MIAPRAFAGTLRNAAPQYGAPGLPGNPPLPQPSAFASRVELASLDFWTKSSVTVLDDQSTNNSLYYDRHPSRTAFYLLPSGSPVSLNLINQGSTSYVVSGPAAFYVSYGGELYGAKFLEKEVVLTPSLFKTPTPAAGDGEAITRFLRATDEAAIERLSAPAHSIRIRVDAAPWSGWGIHSASMANGILQVEGLAIDLKTMQVAAPRK